MSLDVFAPWGDRGRRMPAPGGGLPPMQHRGRRPADFHHCVHSLIDGFSWAVRPSCTYAMLLVLDRWPSTCTLGGLDKLSLTWW